MVGNYQANNPRRGNTQEGGNNRNAASASLIGESFHNPYTFIPFPQSVKRYLPTAITADELPTERFRKSGVLELEVTTLSPLMTCSPKPVSEKNGHKTYKALTIGNDVIVPSTGIRGALRTLMTIISGGTLGYMDEDLWLTQGRDAQLGPNTKMPNVPDNPFLAEVIKPGSDISPGLIQLGKTRLITVVDLKRSIGDLDSNRPTPKKKQPRLTFQDSSGEVWTVKLSGRPINHKGKKEGLFKGSEETIKLSSHFWKTYQGRHRHAVKKTLEKGDLIWLEPVRTDCKKIILESDIKSIQWSRWGRKGKALKEMLPKAILPDSMRDDGGVDMVTDLFGQIQKNVKAAGPFAARIRPGNLIFFDSKGKTVSETLAPLSQPHPGCIAFYRDEEDSDLINKDVSPLKGYKVYRNTKERGDNAPWKYSVQGVYAEKGALKKPEQQKVNKTADFLDEGISGKLRITFRALKPNELALVYAACSVDWRIGGGKPLGLGHCRVTSIKQIDEEGKETIPMEIPMEISGHGENLKLFPKDAERTAHLEKRISLYRASQIPVEKLRYPRAVTKNQNKSSRAGLSWFARHATPKKTGTGLETIWTTGELQKRTNTSQIKAQSLPNLNPDDPTADLLYGYDMVELDVNRSDRNQRMVGQISAFDKATHTETHEQSGKNTSQNRETRQSARVERTSESIDDIEQITKETIGAMIAEAYNDKRLSPERAKVFLRKMEAFDIKPGQSQKWNKKFGLLNEIISKK